MAKRKKHSTTNIYFFLTIQQRRGIALISQRGKHGLEHGVIHTITENKLVEKGCAEFKTVRARGGRPEVRLFLTPKGEYVRKL